MGYTQKVMVIGAGISGLACAYRLKQLGAQCLLLEADSRPGGVISTARRDGYLFELGPQCPRFPAPVWQLIKELQLGREFIAGDRSAKRYIYRHGLLHPAPFSPGGLLSTRLIGLASKFRFFAEPFRSTQPPAQEETLAEFAVRKFGSDVLDNLADPVLSTIFFGDAYKMGMESALPMLVEWEKNHGSLIRGAIHARNSKRKVENVAGAGGNGSSRESMDLTDSLPSLGSFRTGMARLPERMAEELDGSIRFGVRAENVSPANDKCRNGGAGWQVSLPNGETLCADHVVLSVPAYEAARLLRNDMPTLAHELESIEYTPLGVVSSGYQRSQVENQLDGFGFMVPRKEGLQTICTFWNSSLFQERAPVDRVLLTSFVRSGTSGEGSEIPEDDLARAIAKENAAILGIAGPPTIRNVWQNTRALPQYNVGHRQKTAAIESSLSALPNLHLIGNYLKGRSLSECVELAFSVAQNVHGRLGETHV